MLTTPIFRTWRPIWDTQFADAMQRLDELIKERQKGRQVPPKLQGDWSDIARALRAVKMAKGRVSTDKFIKEKIEPLIRACVWPRWLLLEAALDYAANSGDLHLSALILRSQIEELDSLRTAATLLNRLEEGSWDGDAMADVMITLMNRVLPRLQVKTEEQLVEQASDAVLAAMRPESLQLAFSRLSEYVHPNYGSHVLFVRPNDSGAAQVLVEAFTAIYEVFLSLPWAKDDHDSQGSLMLGGLTDSRDPLIILADATIPTLKPACQSISEEQWLDAIECFRHYAANERIWASASANETNVEAIRILREGSIPTSSWPESLSTVAGQNRYAFLVAHEKKLAQKAAHLVAGTGQNDDTERLSIVVTALKFSINLTEHKLNSMARQAARLINSENVLGATLVIRSMLEHHAVAIELGKKLEVVWERMERKASNNIDVTEVFAEAEKQIARVLAGSSQPFEVSLAWRTLWKDTVRKPYNVQEPIKALNDVQSGFLQTYGLLSHIMHGTVGTGGDLIGVGGEGWRSGHRQLAAQLTQFLANLCKFDAMLDRTTAAIIIGTRLDDVQHASQPAEHIKKIRLPKEQKLKQGRDIWGAGTKDEPYRFRQELIYHDAYFHYLKQEGIRDRNRRVVQLAEGFADCVEAENGDVFYFLIGSEQ